MSPPEADRDPSTTVVSQTGVPSTDDHRAACARSSSPVDDAAGTISSEPDTGDQSGAHREPTRTMGPEKSPIEHLGRCLPSCAPTLTHTAALDGARPSLSRTTRAANADASASPTGAVAPSTTMTDGSGAGASSSAERATCTNQGSRWTGRPSLTAIETDVTTVRR